ncbi:MAG: glycosyltransferase family 2 protein [Pseudomonadota bacterium]
MRGQAETETAPRRISAIVVSWRTGPVLYDAVDAVLSASDIDELVLVNHDNPPETNARLRTLAEQNPKITLVETGANLGFSKGCNIGAKAASGSHLLFLNPDAVIPSGAAARLAETGRTLTEPWIAGARILDADGQEQRGGRRGPLTLWSAFLSMTGLSRLSGLSAVFRDMHRENEPCPDAMISVATVSGAAMMMSRTGFDRLGGFDEDYFLHVEDIDLCRRARDAGGEVVFEPRAQLVHYGATSRAGVFAVERHKAVGLARYFWKFSSGAGRVVMLIAIPLVFAAVTVRAVLLKAGFGIGLVARRRKAMHRLKRRQAAAKATGTAREASR